MLNSRVIKEECRENRNQEPVLYYLYLCTRRYVSDFLQHQVVYLFMGQMRLPEGYTYSLMPDRAFSSSHDIINLIASACMPGFSGKQVLKGILLLFPLYLYYGGIQRIPDDLYIQICQLTFLRIIVLWALSLVTALVLGGIIVPPIFRPGFRPFRCLCHYSHGVLHPPGICKPDYWIARYNICWLWILPPSVKAGRRTATGDFYYL